MKLASRRFDLRRIVILATVTLFATASAALTAPAASAETVVVAAATPTCNKKLDFYDEIGGVGITVRVPAYNGKSNCLLTSGNYNNAGVTVLQHTIVNYYYKKLKLADTNITIDGDYGWGTTLAVKSVQRKVKVTDDGTYGPKTKNQMCWFAPGDLSWVQCKIGHLLP